MEDRSRLDEIEAVGGSLLEDYGAFLVVDLPRSAAGSLARTGVFQPLENKVIRLNRGPLATSIDPRGQRAPDGSAEPRLQLVQFHGPIKPEWKAQLEQDGFRIISYVPENTYLVYGGGEASSKLSRSRTSRRHIQWHANLLAEDKLHPRTQQRLARFHRDPGKATETFSIQLVKDPAANAKTLGMIRSLQSGPIQRQFEVLDYVNLEVPLPLDQVELIAMQPDVISVRTYVAPVKHGERQNQVLANQVSGDAPAGPGYLAWLNSMGFSQEQFDASGFVVNVSDSGIDNGTNTPAHFGFYRLGDTGDTSRVAYNRLEGTPNIGSVVIGCDGHGTLNASIIAGYDTQSAVGHRDQQGYQYGLGVCPFVQVGSSVIFDPNFFTRPVFADMFSRAYDDGARISSESWGAPVDGDYDFDAQAYDALVRDAQPDGAAVTSTGNQEMVVVMSVGNQGPLGQTMGSPATAKNVLSVGASESVQSLSATNGGNSVHGEDGCSYSNSLADSANDMAWFSSRGPCTDLRLKPELVAPGTHISGYVSQDDPPPAPSSTGNDHPCFLANGICALKGSGTSGSTNNFFPQGQEFFSVSSGTSHSAPAVSGAAALLRQFFLNMGWTPPSPAMTKAWLSSSTRRLTGDEANDDLWSPIQGMGLLNLEEAFTPGDRVLRDQEAEDTFTSSGETRTFAVTVPDTGTPVKVVLAWTDAPGNTLGGAYNNDLDLKVLVNGSALYRGNVFTGSWSVTGGLADPRNNMESVFLPAGAATSLVVEIMASSINSDGVPNEGPSMDQDFALAVFNGNLASGQLVVADGAVISAENCGQDNGHIDPGEQVSVNFSLKNIGSANTTNLLVTLQSGNGVSPVSGPQIWGVLTNNGVSESRSYTFTASGSCGTTIVARLSLQDGAADLGTADFAFTLGKTSTFFYTNSNTTPIDIPMTTGRLASPYPSSIYVSNAIGSIEHVTVTLPEFHHTWPQDIDVLLVGPGGQDVVLMSLVGNRYSVTNITITFDQEASMAAPYVSQLTDGSYRPASPDLGLIFSNPAPFVPYGESLDVFKGTDPNGTWSLYIMDIYNGDSGGLPEGWSLSIETSEDNCCGSSQPPVLEPLLNLTDFASNMITFNVMASDLSDGDTLLLYASNVPPWATFPLVISNTTASSTFSGIPDATGTWFITFNASDADGLDAQTVSISAKEATLNCSLLISEYAEGSGDNQMIEIFNPTDQDIDLGEEAYLLEYYLDGNTNADFTVVLIGTITNKETYVLGNANATHPLVTILAHGSVGGTWYDGNDAVVLRKGGSAGDVIDSLGQVGFDPGTEWGTGLVSTADNGLRRAQRVIKGDSNPFDAFDPAIEWIGVGGDDFSGFQIHNSDCGIITDTDGDGIPDTWEISMGLDHLDDGSTGESGPGLKDGPNGANGDADLDTFSNFQEYIADTQPTNPLSFLMLESIFGTNNIALTWPGSTGRVYHLQTQPWLLHESGWSSIYTHVQGSATNTMIHTNAVPPSVYRINAELP